MTIETKKASYKDAGEMLKGYTFDFSNENYSDDYKVTKRFFDGTNELGATCFAMIEYVEDGLLRKVRFINTYRETAIDIEIINAAEVNSDAKEENTMTNAIKMTIAKNGAKMYYVDGKRISRDKAIEISNCPQQHIDFLHEKIKNLGKKYRQYYREYRDTHAEEIAV